MTNQSVQAEVIEVTSPQQLVALADRRPWRWFMPAKKIRLRIPSGGQALQQATERRLNFWRGVCGCQAGALLVLAALTWFILGPAQTFDTTLEAVLHGGALVIGAGILGKSVTVLCARAMFIAEAAFFVWRIRREAQQRRFIT